MVRLASCNVTSKNCKVTTITSVSILIRWHYVPICTVAFHVHPFLIVSPPFRNFRDPAPKHSPSFRSLFTSQVVCSGYPADTQQHVVSFFCSFSVCVCVRVLFSCWMPLKAKQQTKVNKIRKTSIRGVAVCPSTSM